MWTWEWGAIYDEFIRMFYKTNQFLLTVDFYSFLQHAFENAKDVERYWDYDLMRMFLFLFILATTKSWEKVWFFRL